MKLKDPKRSPVGGFFYDDPIYGTIVVQGGLDSLVREVSSRYQANGKQVPEGLKAIIEDQICTRQPADRCYYTKGLGDRISRGIHLVAAAVDKVAGTKLQKKARGCGGCARRRMKLN